MKPVNMAGQEFGRLTVVKRVYGDAPKFKKGAVWLCECECGTSKEVTRSNLISGSTVSCGCHSAEVASKNNRTHGLHGHPLYKRWVSMRSRCRNPNDASYKDYGGRGVEVCDEWYNDVNSYISYIESLGWHKGCGLVVDRIDNESGHYKQGEVRLATYSQNASNCKTTEGCSSKYKGVCLDSSSGRWIAQITRDGVRHHLGVFDNEEEALVAYNDRAKELFGEFARVDSV